MWCGYADPLPEESAVGDGSVISGILSYDSLDCIVPHDPAQWAHHSEYIYFHVCFILNVSATFISWQEPCACFL